MFVFCCVVRGVFTQNKKLARFSCFLVYLFLNFTSVLTIFYNTSIFVFPILERVNKSDRQDRRYFLPGT